jgi:hypothetical protein
MKTAVSYTNEELGKILVNLAIHKINHWAKSELNYVRHALEKPLLIPISNNLWVIGDYVIQNIDSHRFKVTKNKITIHTFYSKRAAIFYAALSKVKQYKIADKLLDADIKVARLYDECEFYSNKITSKQKKDNFKLTLWSNRYLNFKMQLHPAKNDLEKTIRSAKYMKIWESLT